MPLTSLLRKIHKLLVETWSHRCLPTWWKRRKICGGSRALHSIQLFVRRLQLTLKKTLSHTSSCAIPVSAQIFRMPKFFRADRTCWSFLESEYRRASEKDCIETWFHSRSVQWHNDQFDSKYSAEMWFFCHVIRHHFRKSISTVKYSVASAPSLRVSNETPTRSRDLTEYVERDACSHDG